MTPTRRMPVFWACCRCEDHGTTYDAADRHTRDTHHPTTTGTREDTVNRVARHIREEDQR